MLFDFKTLKMILPQIHRLEMIL